MPKKKKKYSASKKELLFMVNREIDNWRLLKSFSDDISSFLITDASAEERLELIQNRLLRLKYNQGEKSST